MRPRLRSLAGMIFRRSRWEQDTSDEIRFHIEARAEDLKRSGVPGPDALRQARLEFGGAEVYKERCREARGAAWADELARNLAFAWRSLRKNRTFTAVAVLSLALGIGANAAIFSLLHRLILARAPVRAPERLQHVLLWTARDVCPRLSYPKYLILRDNFDVFEDVFGWNSYSFDLAAGNRHAPVRSQLVTGNYFEALGIWPALGRLLRPEDDRPGAATSVVLGYRLWRTFFQSDPNIVGRQVKLGAQTYQIVGVSPENFSGLERGVPPDLYLPYHAAERFAPRLIEAEGLMGFYTMGHVKPDLPLEAARTILREGWPRFSRPQQAKDGDHSRPEYLVLADGGGGVSSARREFSTAVVVLMSLVVTLLLIACGNLATLLFVRGTARLGEMSIRLALGARRVQLIRQWMTECLLLALLGGVAGLLLARWIHAVLLLFVPEEDRVWLRFEMNFPVVAGTLVLTLAAGLLFGLLPSIRASRGDGRRLIKEQAASVVGRGSRASQLLLSTQFAACLLLVTGAVLFTRTLWNLSHINLGFDQNRVAYGIPVFYATGLPMERIVATVRDAVERLKISPKLEAVSMGSPPIVWGAASWGWIRVDGYAPAEGEDNVVYYTGVAPGYFRTIGNPILFGRDFEEADTASAAPPVAIVDESFVRHYLNGRSPLGQKIYSLNQVQKGRPPKEIIGVVKESKHNALREAEKDMVYYPMPTTATGALLVRAKAGFTASSCEAEIKSAWSAVAGNVPLETGTLDAAVEKSLGRDRLIARLSCALGLLGLLLASIGLYGTTAYSVTSRTREIGLRIALGAMPGAVIHLVCRQNWGATALGILAGLPAAIVASRLVESLLFGVSATDPATLAVSVSVLCVVGLLAGLRPALRAARLDPSRSLRYE